MKIPDVTASWLPMPMPPLSLTGANSATYMGHTTVLSPAVNPTTSLPTRSTSQLRQGAEIAAITPPITPMI